MRFYAPIAKIDAEERMVWGYASTEALDEQGEVVAREALAAALDDYMRFANIREMHQLSAVGVAEEAALDDKGLYVGARVVDERAWAKVTAGVYKGFSIGGKVTARDPADRHVITGVALNEISLVDRPANPEAMFDCWKRAATADERTPATPFNPPVQVWTCGVLGHQHLMKSEAVFCIDKRRRMTSPAEGVFAKADGAQRRNAETAPHGEVEYADPGYQPDGKSRYPIDTERHIRAAWDFINRPRNVRHYGRADLDRVKERIIAAWKRKIDPAGPPAAERQTHGRTTRNGRLHKEAGAAPLVLLDLGWLAECLAIEAAAEDQSPLTELAAELCRLLDALAAAETDQVLDDGAEAEGPESEAGADKASGIRAAASGPAGLMKATAERDALVKTLGEVIPRLDRLAQRVEEIAATPLPPLTAGHGFSAISKREDGNVSGADGLSSDALAAAFARMSKEEQTLTLIKAAHANPLRVAG